MWLRKERGRQMKKLKDVVWLLIIFFGIILLGLLGYNVFLWGMNSLENILTSIVAFVKLLPTIFGILVLLILLLLFF